jgi:hypothetical protein
MLSDTCIIVGAGSKFFKPGEIIWATLAGEINQFNSRKSHERSGAIRRLAGVIKNCLLVYLVATSWFNQVLKTGFVT